MVDCFPITISSDKKLKDLIIHVCDHAKNRKRTNDWSRDATIETRAKRLEVALKKWINDGAWSRFSGVFKSSEPVYLYRNGHGPLKHPE